MPLNPIQTPFSPGKLAEELNGNFNYLNAKKAENARVADDFNPMGGSIKTKLSQLETALSPASGNRPGTVQGDGEYVSIHNGNIQVHKADRLGTPLRLVFEGGDITGACELSSNEPAHAALSIGDGRITPKMLAELSMQAAEPAQEGSIAALLGGIAEKLRRIQGTPHWLDAPPANLSALPGGGAQAQHISFGEQDEWNAAGEGLVRLVLTSTATPIAVYQALPGGGHGLSMCTVEHNGTQITITAEAAFTGYVTAL